MSFIGKSLISFSSINLLNNIEYSLNIFWFFFFDIFEIKFDMIEPGSIIDSSIAVFINSIKLSFNLMSAIFS